MNVRPEEEGASPAPTDIWLPDLDDYEPPGPGRDLFEHPDPCDFVDEFYNVPENDHPARVR